MRIRFSLRSILLSVFVCALATLAAKTYYDSQAPYRMAKELTRYGCKAEVEVLTSGPAGTELVQVEAGHILGTLSCERLLFSPTSNKRAFEIVSQLKHIKELEFTLDEKTEIGNVDFSHLRHLSVTVRSEKPLTAVLQSATDLENLVIYGRTQLGVSTKNAISKQRSLESLWLDGIQISSAELKQLSNLGSLNFLRLSDCKIEPGALARIQEFRKLKSLSLSGNSVNDATIDELIDVTTFHILGLSSAKITDRGIAEVSRMEHLRELDLYGCERITAACIDDLNAMKNLSTLSVLATPIEDDSRLSGSFFLIDWEY